MNVLGIQVSIPMEKGGEEAEKIEYLTTNSSR
jgi:hypothetical protein